jgi:signal transduction histidine kinase/DNA-binding response OmpR family regulator
MKIENRFSFILSSVVVAIIMIAVFSLINVRQYSNNSQRVGHAREISMALSDNLIIMQDVETGMRGFIITGKANYLDPYYAAVISLETNLKLLRQLYIDNPKQSKSLDTLERLSRERIAISKENIIIRQTRGIEEAFARVSTEKGKNLMDSIRAINLRLQKEEVESLDNSILNTEASLKKTNNLVVIGGSFSVLVVIVLIFFIRRTLMLKDNLRKSKEHAEELVKFKDRFLSNMSHEIRTPMNAIIGFTKVILKTDLTSKQKEYLTAIKMSGDSLIMLINDILDLAKVDAGKMTFEKVPFKMAMSISAMLHLFEIKIQEKNLTLIKEYDDKIPSVLLGDPLRLHQIILNLLSNAVKFTNNGKITVSIRLLSESNEQASIEFAVADTGMGIADDKLEKIFENFQQATSGTSRFFGGTGLGLAIVKQLVEAQGGIVSVKSKVNEGSVFSFTLKFLKTQSEAETETEVLKLNNEIKNIKVLVVEDIVLNQLLMKTILDDFGFEPHIAENGKIAIEKLETGAYDVILMDLQMPEMNGFEATQYIRDVQKSDIPIIALTADVTTVDLAKCRAVGINDYISKPVDEKILYIKITSLIKKPMVTVESVPDKNVDFGNGFINLEYLRKITKSNPVLMKEMISLYLEQTPSLVSTMQQSMIKSDMKSLYAAVHKMIPSFLLVGISKDFENIARKIQENALAEKNGEGMAEMVTQLANICSQACIELKGELLTLKQVNS